MDEQDRQRFIALVEEKQKNVSVLDRLAWEKVLTHLDFVDAVNQAANILTTKSWLSPSDFQEDRKVVWHRCLSEYKKSLLRDSKPQYFDPAAVFAMKQIRQDIRKLSEEAAEKKFYVYYNMYQQDNKEKRVELESRRQLSIGDN